MLSGHFSGAEADWCGKVRVWHSLIPQELTGLLEKCADYLLKMAQGLSGPTLC